MNVPSPEVDHVEAEAPPLMLPARDTVCDTQMVWSMFALTTAAGLMVIGPDASSVHPCASVTVTV